MIGTMIAQLREAVRGAVERRVVVLPHLDLLTTSQGGLTAEAREVIPLLYENPELVWLGFKDPSFPLPKVIDNLFPHRVSLLGIARHRLRHLITRKESRKFGREFNPWALYKYVSGDQRRAAAAAAVHAGGRGLPRRPRPGLPPAPPGHARRHARSADRQPRPGHRRLRQGERTAALRRPRRAGLQGGAEQRGADPGDGRTHPQGHDLLGAARHRQDALRQGHRRGDRRRRHRRVGAGIEEQMGRRIAKTIFGRSSTRPGSRRRRSSCSTSWTRSPRPAGLTPAPASSIRWSTSS